MALKKVESKVSSLCFKKPARCSDFIAQNTVLNAKFEEKSCINGFSYIDTKTQDFHGVGKAVNSVLVGI